MGQVGTFVLSQVKAASTAKLYNKLILVPANLTIGDENNFDKIATFMPEEWCWRSGLEQVETSDTTQRAPSTEF